MIKQNKDIDKQHYDDKDLAILVKELPEFRANNYNPYMADCVKLDRKNPSLSWEVEICHKAWLEGTVTLYKFLKENNKVVKL